MYVGNGDVIGRGTRTLYLARENANHFVPLFQSQDTQRHSREINPPVTTRLNSVPGDKPIANGSALNRLPRSQLEDSSSSDNGSERSTFGNANDECYLVVACDSVEALTEQDIILRRCEGLAASHLRNRPTLPCNPSDNDEPMVHADLPMRLPLYHCPFKGCEHQWDSRVAF